MSQVTIDRERWLLSQDDAVSKVNWLGKMFTSDILHAGVIQWSKDTGWCILLEYCSLRIKISTDFEEQAYTFNILSHLVMKKKTHSKLSFPHLLNELERKKENLKRTWFYVFVIFERIVNTWPDSPHSLRKQKVEICSQLLNNPMDDWLWRRIFTSDEKWVHLVNHDWKKK